MLPARCVAAFALAGAFGSACTDSAECGGEALNGPPSSAEFDFSCSVPTANVVLSGPCATGDAGPSRALDPTPAPYFDGYYRVFVSSNDPGVCHVELLLGTGFTYAADVSFATLTGTVYGCSATEAQPVSYLGPTQAEFVVNVPAAACIDAGGDAASDAAAGLGAEGGPDGPSDGGLEAGG